jgi:hypothetical protein
MNTRSITLSLIGLVAGLSLWGLGAGEGQPVVAEPPVAAADDKVPAEVLEARLRAQLLHETIHGALQVMHRDFFREGDRLSIPSASLEDVFRELERSWQVKVSWMSVNAKAMNIDHLPEGTFQNDAAKAITAGAEMFEAVENDGYRYAGAISLGNGCLKCHVPERQSLETRKAALLIAMPLKREALRGK